MATIILDYNTRNVQAQKALNYILSLGFFREQTGEYLRKKIKSSIKEQNDEFLSLVSEQVLAKDWLNKDENEAWKNL